MEKDYQRVWAECLGFIKDNLTGKENEKVFSTWFEPIVPVKLDGNTLIIQVPSPFFYEWLEQNYAVMQELERMQMLHLPVLVGISRKSMIYRLLGTTPEESLNGTTVLNTLSLMKGANILRVHDVREAVEVVKIASLVKSE